MKSFEDLEQPELYRAALEDFAVEVEAEDNADTIRAALLEAGIKWADYLRIHPELAPAVDPTERVPEPARAGSVVTTKQVLVEAEELMPKTIRVAQKPVVNPDEPWLIKMTRENVLFETRGYRFTQEHPYALVEPEDGEYILDNEDGFRLALPRELSEFYG
jgi:hypothetical protein